MALAVVYGDAGVGKTSGLCVYAPPMLVATPDPERFKQVAAPFRRKKDVVTKCVDLERLLKLVQSRKAREWPGIIVVDDYSVMCQEYLGLVTAVELKDKDGKGTGKWVQCKPQLDHFGTLNTYSKLCIITLKARRSIILTHPDPGSMSLGPGAGTTKVVDFLARVCNELVFLRRTELEDTDPVQGFTTRIHHGEVGYESKLTLLPNGEHPPYYPAVLPAWMAAKSPVLTPKMLAMGKALVAAGTDINRRPLIKRALQTYPKEIIRAAFQHTVWSTYKPELTL